MFYSVKYIYISNNSLLVVYITAECRREMFSLWLDTTSKHRVVEKDS